MDRFLIDVPHLMVLNLREMFHKQATFKTLQVTALSLNLSMYNDK